MKVRYSRRAFHDLENIRTYIAKDNLEAARRVASFIRQSISKLEEFPYQGRATDEKNAHRLVVTRYPYIVHYRVLKTQIDIVTILHAAQNQ